MFARIRKNGGSTRCSVIVCHSIRKNGKVRQIIVKTLGHSSDKAQLAVWFNEAKDWIAEHGPNWLKQHFPVVKQATPMSRPVNLFNLREVSRQNIGICSVFGKLYDELGFDTLLSSPHQETLKKVLFSRLLEPSSKRRISQISKEKLGEDLPLDRIYRMMDALQKEEEKVNQLVFSGTYSALEGKISLVLFDVTTLSFETVSEDELRAFGYSKDCKFNTTQVVLALATTKEGLPIGYRLFPGNTAESTTLISSINEWRNHIPIDEVTIVGDRAMMTKQNLTSLEEAGFYYVVAYPLRKLPKAQQLLIKDVASYEKNKESDDEISKCKIIDFGEGRKILSSYSEKRAKKDKKDRDRLINKLEKKLSTCKNVKRLVNNKGYLKYTEIKGQATACVDVKKLEEEAAWDGLHGVITNKPNINSHIYKEYRRLWVIEESFRINKHSLKMRPIYHFTPKRIQAHILLCYMVFTLIRQAQYKLNVAGHSMSVNKIIDSLKNIQASILQDITNDKKYRVLSQLNEDATVVYKAFGLSEDMAVTPI